MKRRKFIKQSALASFGLIAAPYILPTGRLFASTGTRLANHVVFMLFGGGLRNQEAVKLQYLINQNASLPSGNIMPNIFSGSAPSSNIIYNPVTPILSTPIDQQGTLFKEVRYKTGPTGHFNGHTVAMTGKYTETGLNLNINPDAPTIFEYYRKHTSPTKSALNAWWISEGLGPYPALNYSKHSSYGSQFGANFMCPSTLFSDIGYNHLYNIETFHPAVSKIKNFLNNNFSKVAADLPGIQNAEADRDRLKNWVKVILDKAKNSPQTLDLPKPNGNIEYTGDLITVGFACEVLKEFKPELLVVNMFDIDVCHDTFTNYIKNIHLADYAIGHLWNKIQSIPDLQNDTIMIIMPEHGRNLSKNSFYDDNGLQAYDHTSDDNSREIFTLIAGPNSVVKQQSISTITGESIDVVPTISKILGFYNDIPSGLLSGRTLDEAFV